MGVSVGSGVSVTGGVGVSLGMGVAVGGKGVLVKVGRGVRVGRGPERWATGVLVAQARVAIISNPAVAQYFIEALKDFGICRFIHKLTQSVVLKGYTPSWKLTFETCYQAESVFFGLKPASRKVINRSN
jgi:hypothetical protein